MTEGQDYSSCQKPTTLASSKLVEHLAVDVGNTAKSD